MPSLDLALGAIPGAVLAALPALAVSAAAMGAAIRTCRTGAVPVGSFWAMLRGELVREGPALALVLAAVLSLGSGLGAARDYVTGRAVRRLAHVFDEGVRLLVLLLGGAMAFTGTMLLSAWIVLSSPGELLQLHLALGWQLLALVGWALFIGVPLIVGVCERRRGSAAFGASLRMLARTPDRYAAVAGLVTCGWLFWSSFPPLQLRVDELGRWVGALRGAAVWGVLGVLLIGVTALTLARYYPRTAEDDAAREAEEKALLRRRRLRRLAFFFLLLTFLVLFWYWAANPTDRLL